MQPGFPSIHIPVWGSIKRLQSDSLNATSGAIETPRIPGNSNHMCTMVMPAGLFTSHKRQRKCLRTKRSRVSSQSFEILRKRKFCSAFVWCFVCEPRAAALVIFVELGCFLHAEARFVICCSYEAASGGTNQHEWTRHFCALSGQTLQNNPSESRCDCPLLIWVWRKCPLMPIKFTTVVSLTRFYPTILRHSMIGGSFCTLRSVDRFHCLHLMTTHIMQCRGCSGQCVILCQGCFLQVSLCRSVRMANKDPEPKAVQSTSMSMHMPVKLAQKVCVWFSMKCGDQPAETMTMMRLCFQQNCHSKAMVCRWHKSFREGCTKLGDLFCGCHRTKRTDANVKRCADSLGGNCWQSIHEVGIKANLTYGTVQRILHHDLELSKRAAKMVPHLLLEVHKRNCLEFCHEMLAQYAHDPHCLDWILTTDESWFYLYDPRSRMENMEWLHKDENRGQVVHRQQPSAQKVMLVPFFDSRSLLHWEYFHGMTIRKGVMLALLQRIRTSLRIRRGARVWHNRQEYRLHMDNALAHRSDLVQGYLRQVNWEPLKHPPYSPDLSPCDFFLFPKLKKATRGVWYWNLDELVITIEHELHAIDSEQWQLCFKDWIQRCRWCVTFDGSYFEGMKHDPWAIFDSVQNVNKLCYITFMLCFGRHVLTCDPLRTTGDHAVSQNGWIEPRIWCSRLAVCRLVMCKVPLASFRVSHRSNRVSVSWSLKLSHRKQNRKLSCSFLLAAISFASPRAYHLGWHEQQTTNLASGCRTRLFLADFEQRIQHNCAKGYENLATQMCPEQVSQGCVSLR